MRILGWDIGGSNTKVCRVENGEVRAAISRPFEIRHAPHDLVALLRSLAAEAVGNAPIGAHAVTMTAELSRAFLTKREGVAFVLDAVESAFTGEHVQVFTIEGGFIDPSAARREPMRVASANWMATAQIVARAHPDAILVDVGSTTTDVIPIAQGAVAAVGRTDPDRLASGELLYTGAVRTPVEALAFEAEVRGRRHALAAEGFATSGDVHVWRGDLAPEDYTGETADGRPATRAGAADRLRRALCADRDLMDEGDVGALADALADSQVARVARAVGLVRSRHPAVGCAVVMGLGSFIGARAARATGLDVSRLADEHGDGVSRCAPAAAVAWLLGEIVSGARHEREHTPVDAHACAFDVVVKIGGGLLAYPETLRDVLEVVAGARRVLVVPGGGPFADVVRHADRGATLDDTAAHWMAILAMDQYAELLIGRLRGGRRVETLADARHVAASQRVPVLAPSRWLRHADPLPHSWDVTSDSIAAWVAGQAGARRVVLVKPPGAPTNSLDSYFDQALPPSVAAVIVPGERLDLLAMALGRA